MKILIFGVAAVQADAIIMLKEMGHEVHAIARRIDGPGAALADKFTPIDFSNTTKVIAYIKDNGIDVIYSVGSDAAMPQVNYISEILNMPKFNNADVAKICNDKPTLRKILGDQFSGNIQHTVLTNQTDLKNLAYPVIIKPADSQGQRGVLLIENESELKANFEYVQQYSSTGRVIAEQYIGGHEVSVNGYVIDGKLVFCLISNRITWKKFLGRIHKHVIPYQAEPIVFERIRKMIEQATERIGVVNGPIYAQIKVEDQTPYIIEYTPRLDGCHMWKLIRYSSGFNLLKLTLEHLINQDTTELNKFDENNIKPYILEFMCQQPLSPADYDLFEHDIASAEEHYFYYQQKDIVRSINGVWDKIGYIIYPTEDNEAEKIKDTAN